MIAATLEQKVWLTTFGDIYPNLYIGIVGHPGVGKTRAVREAKRYYIELPEHHLAPTSLTASSLIDALSRSKRLITGKGIEKNYNSMVIMADELGAFMHEYPHEMIAVLCAFYDVDIYGQERRGQELKVKIKNPQLSMIIGSTPSNLIKFLPDYAWEQGFTSRLIFVFSDERSISDDFAEINSALCPNLLHDLKVINGLYGQFEVTQDYKSAVSNWREHGEPVVPTHPKLLHYATRRKMHLYKLSMVSAVDRSNELLLTKDDFNRAMHWLLTAEKFMPDIFKAGTASGDSKAMDEIYHYVLTSGIGGKGVPEHRVINFARERVPVHSVTRLVQVMVEANMIKVIGQDRTGTKRYTALVPDVDDIDD